MSLRALRREGHWPSLAAALLHFEVSFGIWVLLGALGPLIARDLRLSPAAKGVVVATPLLSAAVFRVLVGWLADRFGPRRVGTVTMTLALAPLALGWRAASSTGALLAVGALLGVAGASFAVALPLASAHYPAKRQGLALGIAGAGNSGTVLAALIAPRVAEHVGWRATMGLAMIPVALSAIAFRFVAREPPRRAGAVRLRDTLAALREADCWRACGLYAVTFGGYVGFTSFLPLFLVDRFEVSRVTAGSLAALAAGTGSLLRPVGGFLADRFGGTRVLARVYSAAAVLVLALSAMPGLFATEALFVGLLGLLGAGNGAVFQLVPLRFGERIGVVTGLVGAAGGVGGFFLPTGMGIARQATGSASLGFWLFAAAAVAAASSVVAIRVRWSRRLAEAGLAGTVL